jgi:hypothetical protein
MVAFVPLMFQEYIETFLIIFWKSLYYDCPQFVPGKYADFLSFIWIDEEKLSFPYFLFKLLD